MTLLSGADRQALEARWQEPHRHYHTLQHLEECLALFDAMRDEAQQPNEVEAALWFHDAIYDPRAADNEQRSAALAAEVLAVHQVDAAAVSRIQQMILATRHEFTQSRPIGDAALVCDIDIAILGAAAARFDEYERQVREEYAWVPEPVFRARRAEILSGLLTRPQLFATKELRARLEAPARANLARSLTRLSGAPPHGGRTRD